MGIAALDISRAQKAHIALGTGVLPEIPIERIKKRRRTIDIEGERRVRTGGGNIPLARFQQIGT